VNAARFGSAQDEASAAKAVRRCHGPGQCDFRSRKAACGTKDMIRKDGLQ